MCTQGMYEENYMHECSKYCLNKKYDLIYGTFKACADGFKGENTSAVELYIDVDKTIIWIPDSSHLFLQVA